jgi:hypothetical protein
MNRKKAKPEGGLWKLTPLMEIRIKRGFPPRLEKAAPTTLGFFTSSHKPDGGGSIYLNEVKQTAAHMGSIFQVG